MPLTWVESSTAQRSCGGCPATIRVGDEYFELPVTSTRKLIRCAACGYRMIESREQVEKERAEKAERELEAERKAIQEDADGIEGKRSGEGTGEHPGGRAHRPGEIDPDTDVGF